jgi:hypothetical protein
MTGNLFPMSPAESWTFLGLLALAAIGAWSIVQRVRRR